MKKMKKCTKCGHEIETTETICNNCGHKFLNKKIKDAKKGKSVIGRYSFITGIISILFSLTELGVVFAIIGICLGVYVMFSKKELYYKTAIAGVLLSMFSIAVFSNYTTKNNDYEKDSNTNSSISKETEINNSTEKPTKKPKTDKQNKKEYIKSCMTYNYKDVLRKPDKYIGNRIREKVKISSVHEKGLLNDTKYYFANSKDEYDSWYGDEYVIFDNRSKQSPKLLEDDIIEVYGEIAEPEETVSLIVNSSEVFAIDMKYVKLISE